jgi:hypothetical protein
MVADGCLWPDERDREALVLVNYHTQASVNKRWQSSRPAGIVHVEHDGQHKREAWGGRNQPLGDYWRLRNRDAMKDFDIDRTHRL